MIPTVRAPGAIHTESTSPSGQPLPVAPGLPLPALPTPGRRPPTAGSVPTDSERSFAVFVCRGHASFLAMPPPERDALMDRLTAAFLRKGHA